MTTARKLSAGMIPAIEIRINGESSVGDIGSVPAIKAIVAYGDRSVTCVGIIDTGADMCVLDRSLAAELGLDEEVPLAMTSGLEAGAEASLQQVGLGLQGEAPGDELRFSNVPVNVIDLHRPILLLGRRGVLERLRVDLDFPGGRVTITQARKRSGAYPALVREIPASEEAIESMRGGDLVDGIMTLSMAMERFLDDVILRDETFRGLVGISPLRRAPLGEKLWEIASAKGYQDLDDDIQTFVRHQYAAIHEPDNKTQLSATLSMESFLGSAERIVSCLSSA